MPRPGDPILFVATLLPVVGTYPSTASCEIEIRDADNNILVVKTAMTNIFASVFSYTWVTDISLPIGSYMAVYYAVIDGQVSPEVVETVYVDGADEDCAFQESFQNMIEQMWISTHANHQSSYSYDSQGRTYTVIKKFSETDDFTSPLATYRMTFSYNSDNSLSSWSCIKL